MPCDAIAAGGQQSEPLPATDTGNTSPWWARLAAHRRRSRMMFPDEWQAYLVRPVEFGVLAGRSRAGPADCAIDKTATAGYATFSGRSASANPAMTAAWRDRRMLRNVAAHLELDTPAAPPWCWSLAVAGLPSRPSASRSGLDGVSLSPHELVDRHGSRLHQLISARAA
jgi:hypothetical protein